MNLRIHVYLSEPKAGEESRSHEEQEPEPGEWVGLRTGTFLSLWFCGLSSVLLSAHLLHSPLLADLLPLFSMHRRWQWWFTAPVLHAPFKTRGNQLLSDSQPQIPMRDKLRSQASISNLPLTARGIESPRINLAPRPTSDEGGGTSQGLGVNGQVRHTFQVSPIHLLNAEEPVALVQHTETDKTKATSLSQESQKKAEIWNSKKMIPDSQGHMAGVPRSTGGLQKWKNPTHHQVLSTVSKFPKQRMVGEAGGRGIFGYFAVDMGGPAEVPWVGLS